MLRLGGSVIPLTKQASSVMKGESLEGMSAADNECHKLEIIFGVEKLYPNQSIPVRKLNAQTMKLSGRILLMVHLYEHFYLWQ